MRAAIQAVSGLILFLFAPAFAQTMDGGVSVPMDESTQVAVNPILKACLLPNTSCILPPSGQVGHLFRIFLPGAAPQETTGFYDRNMVWLSKSSNSPPTNAKFKVEAFFAPNCSPVAGQNSCIASSFRFFYQLSALNQPPGEKRISPKNNFSAPKIVTREDILKNVQDPLASIMLTGNIHSFRDCLGMGSGSCVIGASSGGATVCLDTGSVPAMQQHQGSSYCAIPNGCPAGWTDVVGNRDGNNPCGVGPCCQ